MQETAITKSARRPRFRRAEGSPSFRLTDDDAEILRHLARHRFLRSTHIAALVCRSLDRTNDRLCHLFHAGYVDRPRAQLDYRPTGGSSPMVYALADRGARLLAERDGRAGRSAEWSRKNGEAGRPFIEHQLEIVDFHVSLLLATRTRGDVRFMPSEEIIAGSPEETRSTPNPFAVPVALPYQAAEREIALIPDLVFGLMFADGSRRCFMVEIDRGTMPITRTNVMQTSFERKMRGYLAIHAAGEHERRFGWKTFRVLTVTTDERRVQSMMEALRQLHVSRSPGASLFFFATREELHASDPLALAWRDGNGRQVGVA